MPHLDFSAYPFTWLLREPGFLMPAMSLGGNFGSRPVKFESGERAATALMERLDGLKYDAIYLPMSVFRTPLNRKAENIAYTFGLVMDVDLNNYLGIGKDDVQGLPDDHIEDALHQMRVEIEDVLKRYEITLPHLVVNSGYGLYFYWWLAPSAGDPEVRHVQTNWLHWIADLLDDEIGPGLVERNTLDPGTRITRIVGSLNLKGPTERRVKEAKERFDQAGLTIEDLDQAEVRAKPTGEPWRPGRPRVLEQSVRDELVAFLTHHWRPGRRHHLAVATAGLLAKWGVSPEETTLLIKSVCQAAGDDEFDDRLRAIGTTFNRIAAGKQISGFYGLRGALLGPERVAFEALIRRTDRTQRAKVNVKGPGQSSQSDEQDEPIAPEAPRVAPNERVVFTDPPPEIMRGWIGQYIETMQKTTEAPAAFHLGCGLTAAGSVIGRSVGVQYGSAVVFPNLYTMLVGVSGKTRKDSAIKLATTFLRTRISEQGRLSSFSVSILTDIGSSEGLLQYLSEHPSTLLHISELSRLLSNKNRGVTSSISPMLMELWDSPEKASSTTRNNPITVEKPFLSALAAVQPDVLADQINDSDIHSGFANRWLYICGNGGSPIPWPAPLDRSQLELLGRLVAAQVPQDLRTLHLAPGATDFWTDWYLERFHASGSPEELSMQQRVPVNAVKIALIHAVLNGHGAIELPDLEMGAKTAEWAWNNVRLLLGEWGGTNDQRIVSRVLAVLETVPNPVPRPYLVHLTNSRRWSVRDFNLNLEAMEKSGLVVLDHDGAVSLGWRKPA